MGFSLLADESVDFRIVSFLREKQIEVLSIREEHSGISDEEVILLRSRPDTIQDNLGVANKEIFEG